MRLNRTDINNVIEFFSDYNELEVKDVLSKSRKRELALTRQEAIYFIKKYSDFTLKEIGTYFNNFDHTTIIHSVNTIDDLIDYSEKYSDQYYLKEKKLVKQLFHNEIDEVDYEKLFVALCENTYFKGHIVDTLSKLDEVTIHEKNIIRRLTKHNYNAEAVQDKQALAS